MNLKEDIKSITELKTHPADILSQVNRTHRPMIITQNGRAQAVVQDIDSYEKTRKALLLLKLAAQSEAQIREGHFKTHKDVSAYFEKKLRV
jgi:prevent-host-death family protein